MGNFVAKLRITAMMIVMNRQLVATASQSSLGEPQASLWKVRAL